MIHGAFEFVCVAKVCNDRSTWETIVTFEADEDPTSWFKPKDRFWQNRIGIMT